MRRTKKDEYIKMYNFLTHRKPIKTVPHIKRSISEHDVVEEIKSYCKQRDIEYFRNLPGGFITPNGCYVKNLQKGVADFTLYIGKDRKSIEVEVKKGDGGTLSIDQQDRQKLLGCDKYIVVHSADELDKKLKEFGLIKGVIEELEEYEMKARQE